ncbi:MAG: M20 aminoacylase family protein [Ghiorsea sp.]
MFDVSSFHKDFQALQTEMQAWRRHLHQHPETAYEEFETSSFIVGILKDLGLTVHQGLAGTGVVATLKAGHSNQSIALRADMDALPVQELNDISHRSKTEGKMHACGHDGHTAMLLGAAKHLAQNPNFDGTIYFVFQPAEESFGGADKMIKEGLFDLFPAQSIFGMHNFPDLPQGQFAAKPGAIMASFDTFEIILHGKGCHAAKPHQGHDPLLAASQLILALQSIVSRNIAPHQPAVVSVTQIHGGTTWNIIPETAQICGTFRCLDDEVRKQIKQRIEDISTSVCAAMQIKAEVTFNPGTVAYPATINSEKETKLALDIAANLVGEENINREPQPSMGAEDFSFMLQHKPGCYVWLGGNTAETKGMLHHPQYDFNDEILGIGAAYWIRLVETLMPVASQSR